MNFDFTKDSYIPPVAELYTVRANTSVLESLSVGVTLPEWEDDTNENDWGEGTWSGN